MLTQQIDADLKTALKEKKEIELSALRNLKAALKNAEIEKMSREAGSASGGKPTLTDEEALTVVSKKVKQHKDSIEGFKSGGRSDLVDHETAQMQVLQKYLPKQMSETELASIVSESILVLNASASDFGKVMKDVVSKVKGTADGSMISKIVKEQLAKK